MRLDPDVPGPAGSTELFRNADKVGWSLGGRWDRPAPVAHLVVLEPERAGPSLTSVGPLERREVVAAIAPHAPWYEDPDRRARALFGTAVRLAGAGSRCPGCGSSGATTGATEAVAVINRPSLAT